MESNKLIIIDPENMPDLVRAICVEFREILKNEKTLKEPRLDTNQIMKIYGYTRPYWTNQIGMGKLGKQDRNGRCTATLKEVEEFLFNSK